MSAADKLAQVLAEHDCYRWQVDLDGPADAIVCGCGTVIPEQDAGYAEDWHRAHVAAVVLAHLTAEAEAEAAETYARSSATRHRIGVVASADVVKLHTAQAAARWLTARKEPTDA